VTASERIKTTEKGNTMSFDWAKAISTVQTIWNVKKTVQPFITDLVQTAGAMLPGSQFNNAKLDLVKQQLQSIATTAGIVEQDFILAWPVIAQVIAATVTALNLSNGWMQAVEGISAIVNIVGSTQAAATTTKPATDGSVVVVA
jgi:hypothetical protein